MKLLILDNNLHIKGYPQPFMIKKCLPVKPLVCKPHELNETHLNVDKVILTGSMSYVRQEKPWMKKEQDFIKKWNKNNIPILGICFGAQLLAITLFGNKAVEPMPIPITGSIMFNPKKSKLFKNLPNKFGVVTTHYDGIKIPKKHITGEIEFWPCYSFEYNNCYGIQFHPELFGMLGRTLIKIQRLIYDRHVYQEFDVKSDLKIGKKIFKNFLEL